MRNLVLALTCGAALLSSACGSQSNTNNTAAVTNGNASPATRTAQQPAAIPPISSAHGDNPVGGGSSSSSAPAPGNAGGSAKPGGLDTAALDAKITQAEAKAKARGASQADKLAAAAAYLQRGNLYRDAGQPPLYKFALRDYRYTLRYQPDNAEAREKMDEIVKIYQLMGRPVPDDGVEP